MSIRKIVSLAAVVLLLTAGSASAALFSMKGEWFLKRGRIANLPQQGGQKGCNEGPIAIRSGCVGQMTGMGRQVVNGGVPGSGFIQAGASKYGSIQIPVHFFSQPQRGSLATYPITFAITVIQLATDFGGVGPKLNAVLEKSAHLAQPGRLAKNFSWCPGATPPSGSPPFNPGCTAPPNPNLRHQIKYTANTAAFGGTMAFLIQGSGNVASIRTPPKANVGPFGGQGMQGGTQHPGRGYASVDTDMVYPGSTFSTFMVGTPCTLMTPNATPMPPGCGLITGLGAKTNSGIGSDTNTNWGFPWTTGMVTAINKSTIQQFPQSTTFIVSGTNNRNAAGAGFITLVAGGASHRVIGNNNFTAIDIVTMRLNPVLPSLSRPGMAAGVALLALTAGYALRRKF